MVMFQAVNILSGTKATIDGRCGPQVQECWEFEHPRREALLNPSGMLLCFFLLCKVHTHTVSVTGLPFTNSHNARSAKLRFYIPHAGVLQCVVLFSWLTNSNTGSNSGLAGYFEAASYFLST